jgi:hypothetical protein
MTESLVVMSMGLGGSQRLKLVCWYGSEKSHFKNPDLTPPSLVSGR